MVLRRDIIEKIEKLGLPTEKPITNLDEVLQQKSEKEKVDQNENSFKETPEKENKNEQKSKETKICSLCQQEKNLEDDFYKKGNKYENICKSCKKQRAKQKTETLKNGFISLERKKSFNFFEELEKDETPITGNPNHFRKNDEEE